MHLYFFLAINPVSHLLRVRLVMREQCPVLASESISSRCPSIFEDGDNVYDTYALREEDPRHRIEYATTVASAPKSIRKAA